MISRSDRCKAFEAGDHFPGAVADGGGRLGGVANFDGPTATALELGALLSSHFESPQAMMTDSRARATQVPSLTM